MPYLKLDIPCAKRQINFEKKKFKNYWKLIENSPKICSTLLKGMSHVYFKIFYDSY